MEDNIFGVDIFTNIKKQEEVVNNSVDFYGIFRVLYELLEKLGVLNTKVMESDPTKLSFVFGYPDKVFTDQSLSTVTFDIIKRERLTYKTSVGNIKQEKPRELVEYKDPVTGQIKRIGSYSYDNTIALDVFSTSCERLFQIVQYLETMFTKYDGYLQKYFTKVVYLGMTTTSNTAHNLYQNRMFNKTLCFQIITESPFELLFEEIQEINQTKLNPNNI